MSANAVLRLLFTRDGAITIQIYSSTITLECNHDLMIESLGLGAILFLLLSVCECVTILDLVSSILSDYCYPLSGCYYY